MNSVLIELQAGAPFKQEPRNRLCRAAGGAAPEGLEAAAPSLPAQAWTGDRGEASRKPRPARPRAVREATSVGAISIFHSNARCGVRESKTECLGHNRERRRPGWTHTCPSRS
ncbi:hypothetical protein F7R28_01125 [Polaromonas sp. Pch-P]|nr:hypothetical protein F7R28_01125 [Polaromonas sp. Pch-P]